MRDLCFNCPYNKGLELGNGCGNDTCIQENMLFEKDEEPVEISCWRAVMEEKERYEIHIYDDICVDLYDNGVLDKSINDTYKLEKLLNQQDNQIKELEEMQKAYKEISYNETLQTFELNNTGEDYSNNSEGCC